MTKIDLPIVKGYAIFNPTTKKWSRGGVTPKWGNKPKIWPSIGTLNNHLAQHIYSDYHPYKPEKTKLIVTHYYHACILIDVVTQEPCEHFDILAYLMDHASKHYYAKQNRPIEVIKP